MNSKLKCLLLDDELPGLTYLKLICEEIPDLEIVKAFDRPEAFLKALPDLDFDLCILDIEMPTMNGLQVARMLQGKPVIFTTAYKDYAADAFDLNAVDYVIKPVRKERLLQAVAKAQKQHRATHRVKQFIQLNTDKGKALIFFDQLCYITTSNVDSRDKMAQLQDGTFVTLKNIPFEKLLELLPDDEFVRVNKKELIAVRMIQVFQFNEVTTTLLTDSGDVLKLTLNEAYREDFVRKVKL